jgi:hypothetical protein
MRCELPVRRVFLAANFIVIAVFFCSGQVLLGAEAKFALRDGRVIEGAANIGGGGRFSVQTRDARSVDVAVEELRGVVFRVADAPTMRVSELAPGSPLGAWQIANIGKATELPAVLGVDNGAWVLGSTADKKYARKSDDFHFVHLPMSGDGEVTMRLKIFENRSDYARAGLVLAESVGETAKGVKLLYSSRTGGSASEPSKYSTRGKVYAKAAEMKPPCWLKIERRGSEFFPSWSRDGQKWNGMASTRFTAPNHLLAGAVVSIGKDLAMNHAWFDQLRVTERGVKGASFPQVTLASGSVIAGAITGADQSGISLRAGGRVHLLSVPNVRGIAFDELTGAQAAARDRGRAGVVLANGDFVDGELRSISPGRLAVSSVLFGNREYSAPGQAVALTLRSSGAVAATPWMVALRDGSKLRAKSVALRGESVIVEEALTGAWEFPLEQVTEIQRANAEAPKR